MKKNLTLISLVLGVMLLVSVSGLVSADNFSPFTSSELNNNWIGDRTFPTNGVSSVSAFGRDDVAKIGIDSSNTASGTFYRTEGIKTDVQNEKILSIDLYIDSDWQTKAVRAGFWVVTNEDNYGIIEFVNNELCDVADCSNQGNIQDHTGFRIWDTDLGEWTSINAPFNYGEWVTLTIYLDTSQHVFRYYLNGEYVGSSTGEGDFMEQAFLNSYNYGEDDFPTLSSEDYYVHWYAASCEVTVSEPDQAWYNSAFDIEWEYSTSCLIQPDQDVNFYTSYPTVGSKIFSFGDTSIRSVNWNPTQEGNGFSICLDTELFGTGSEVEGCSSTFGVDWTAPVITSLDRTCDEGETITLTASATDVTSGINTSTWEWNVDGDMTSSYEADYTCVDGPATINAQVTVSDNAGNPATKDVVITVNNVAPTCSIDSATKDMPLIEGYNQASFSGSATDPAGSHDTLSYAWNFGDGASATGTSVEHNYTVAGTYTVTLTVSDEDSGVSQPCTTEIKVIQPTPLGDQEVAAFYSLNTDFGSYNGDAYNEFMHNVGSPDGCQKIEGPSNLNVYDYGGEDTCTIRWDQYDIANPTNDERGDHFVLIRVYDEDNSSDVNYYSFNVAVWSWIIPLEEGWNLVSIPLVPENGNSLDNVLGGIKSNINDDLSGFSVYQYDGLSNDWVYTRPEGSGWSTAPGADLSSINPGYGYWIYMDNADTLKGMGVKQLVTNSRPSVEVSTKYWNLIGRYGIVGYTEGVHGAIDRDLALSNVHKEDNSLHTFDETGSSVDMLENNEGYWMLVEEDYTTDSVSELYTPLDEGSWSWFIDYYDRN